MEGGQGSQEEANHQRNPGSRLEEQERGVEKRRQEVYRLGWERQIEEEEAIVEGWGGEKEGLRWGW